MEKNERHELPPSAGSSTIVAPIDGSSSSQWLNVSEDQASPLLKFTAAVMLGVSSAATMLIMKAILTEYRFVCFASLALLQCIFTVVWILVQRNVLRTIPRFPLCKNPLEVIAGPLFPLPLFFVGNILSGLAATRDLSMPTFVMIRRISILMTLGLQMTMLGKRSSIMVFASLSIVMGGALLGAASDLTLKPWGVFAVMVNNILTALTGVMLRVMMDKANERPQASASTEEIVADTPPRVTLVQLRSEGILFYNSLFSCMCLIPLILFGGVNDREVLYQFEHWSSTYFQVLLFLSGAMGFVINYASMLCTKVNSPLVSSMVGVAKNIFTSYIGVVFSDYVYSEYNFLGLNISLVGAVLYSVGEYRIGAKMRT